MKLVIEADAASYRAGDEVTVRVRAVNDSFEPVALDARLLIGPNPVPTGGRGLPMPVSVEPHGAGPAEHIKVLHPWAFYGRERQWTTLPAGEVAFHAYLLTEADRRLLPTGPVDAQLVAVAAAPLRVTIDGDA